jgi:hypothetical protein
MEKAEEMQLTAIPLQSRLAHPMGLKQRATSVQLTPSSAFPLVKKTSGAVTAMLATLSATHATVVLLLPTVSPVP